jgi:ribosomal protein S18 acetylase RimI-like enzyme
MYVMHIEKMAPHHDLHRVKELLHTTFEKKDLMASDDPIAPEQLARLASDAYTALHIAIDPSGTYAGFCLSRTKKAPEFAHRMYIQALGVRLSERGKGVGGMLVRAALDWGASQGAEVVTLEVVRENEAALRLYDRLGFQATGEIPDGFRKDGVHHNVVVYHKQLV